jgi:hypothetical protein
MGRRSILSVVAVSVLSACSGSGDGHDAAGKDAGGPARGGSNAGGARATGSGGRSSDTGGAGGAIGVGGGGGGSSGSGGRAGGSSGSDAGNAAGRGGAATDDAGADATSEAGSEAGGATGAGGSGAGGRATDASADGSDATSTDSGAVVTLTIVPEATHFLDYGKLRIGFDQAVDATSLEIALSPVSPSRLVVTGVSAVDSTTVDATLGYYHLPRDYQLTVSGKLAGGARFTASAGLPGLNNGSRIAFLTKNSGPGDIKAWTSAPAAAATALEAADAICTAEAEAAGYHGTFAAFLSASGSYDAGCRAFGLTGTIANGCGQSSLPVDHAPWLGVSGLPIVEGATAIVANAWDTPITSHADGSAPLKPYVWTGSLSGAVAGSSDCAGWTNQTTAYGWIDIFPNEYLMSYDGNLNCGMNNEMLCLQVGGSFFGPSTLHHSTGKRAFVSKGTLTGAMAFGGKTGAAAADALCQSEAASAGYANATSFHAYVGTSSDDAVCRILGAAGKAANRCGLSAFPTDTWRRADDYPVANAAELVTSTLVAPLALSPDLSRPVATRPWTGTTANGSTAENCTDWSSSTGNGDVGSPRGVTSGWAYFSTSSCNTAAPVYCFEG